MASITEIAEQFFVACDEGKGWEGCKEFCKPDATFSVQAEPLADIKTLEQYTDWMKSVRVERLDHLGLIASVINHVQSLQTGPHPR